MTAEALKCYHEARGRFDDNGTFTGTPKFAISSTSESNPEVRTSWPGWVSLCNCLLDQRNFTTFRRVLESEGPPQFNSLQLLEYIQVIMQAATEISYPDRATSIRGLYRENIRSFDMAEVKNCSIAHLRATKTSSFRMFLLLGPVRFGVESPRAVASLLQHVFSPTVPVSRNETAEKKDFFGRGVADTKLRAAQLATGRGAGHRSGTVSLYLAHAVIMNEFRAFISIVFYEFDRSQAPGRMMAYEGFRDCGCFGGCRMLMVMSRNCHSSTGVPRMALSSSVIARRRIPPVTIIFVYEGAPWSHQCW